MVLNVPSPEPRQEPSQATSHIKNPRFSKLAPKKLEEIKKRITFELHNKGHNFCFSSSS
jgi:hypothetical protein